MGRRLADDVLAATGGDDEGLQRHVLESAFHVIETHGLAAATSRAVSAASGVSAGTLYKHFDNHTRLLARAIVHRATTVAAPAQDLPSRAGRGTVRSNLAYFGRQAAAVLDQLLPVMAATFSDAALLQAVREEMASVPALDDPAATVERYLAAEQERGRVAPDADLRAAAAIVVSMCHDDAFNRYLLGAGGRPRHRTAELDLVVRALTPDTGEQP